ARLRQQVLRQANKNAATYTFDSIAAADPESLKTKQLAMKIAESELTVLLQAESGTGKELYAQAIHNHSRRNQSVFLAVNCANFQANMLESELFGYVEGAFTGAKKGGKIGLMEAAKGGTLFLDEISEMDLGLQAKLLRALQERKIRPVGSVEEREIDVRIVCACNADLEEYIRQGKFRKDLYYRLNTSVIKIPPLRERREDIPPITDSILNEIRHRQRRQIFIAEEAMVCLKQYDWPGNVRELRNVLEFSAYMCEEDTIVLASLPTNLVRESARSTEQKLAERVKRFERSEIEQTLLKYGNTLEGKKQAASALGISLATLYNKMNHPIFEEEN
ncbi:MAG: sigma-54 interaction domain-containing protein, partial [Anaerovoracaceae bacterium]